MAQTANQLLARARSMRGNLTMMHTLPAANRQEATSLIAEAETFARQGKLVDAEAALRKARQAMSG